MTVVTGGDCALASAINAAVVLLLPDATYIRDSECFLASIR